jgi:threonyl-tRNA synthetase
MLGVSKWGIQKHNSKNVLKNSSSLKNPLNQNLLENKNAEKRELSSVDHRVLGQQLDLFSISEDVGTGLILWHPKGTVIRNLIRDFWEREHLKSGYELVCTPHIARSELWQISGHLDYYKDNMYIFNKDGENFVVKPMNCPFHIQIYKAQSRSYKELPIRYAEWGTVYRYERSGTLLGLMRVRGFTQDDAHIFCAANQVEQEILNLLDFAKHLLQKFEFNEYRAYLSSRDPEQPNKYMGSQQKWDHAQNCLARALKKKRMLYKEMPGEAVFYGPKIDLNIVDASGREWQCTTIQFDFNLPKRFNMTYVGADGKGHEVVMIHRALLGAVERFFAILTEHCKGNFPAWLAPTQVAVLPVSSGFIGYAREVKTKLLTYGIRTKIDEEPSTIGYKIRQAELQKVPYMAIIGKREAETKKISVREHGPGDLGSLTIQALLKLIKKESMQ